jgi:glutathione S-transferase
MKLWSGVLSPFSAKVRIALAEKGLPYETLEIGWNRQTLWGPKPPEFLAVSPRGKVPVLIDGGATLYDSTIINEYLEDRYPKPALFPADPVARGRCRQLEGARRWPSEVNRSALRQARAKLEPFDLTRHRVEHDVAHGSSAPLRVRADFPMQRLRNVLDLQVGHGGPLARCKHAGNARVPGVGVWGLAHRFSAVDRASSAALRAMSRTTLPNISIFGLSAPPWT